ncbi:MAG: hypothetical protein V1924_05870 [Candidatus Bathyarchaeota archaeon]
MLLHDGSAPSRLMGIERPEPWTKVGATFAAIFCAGTLGFLGWFLGKSMQETGGFAWAWLIHFLQDVIIFTFFLM